MKKSKGKSTRPDARAWWGKNRLSCIILAAAVVVFIIVRALAATHEQPQARGEDYAEYETAVITDVLSDNTEQDPVSDNGYRGEQLLLAEIRTGQYMQVSNYVGPLYGQALKEGQRAVVLISTYSDGNHTATVYEYDRAVGLAVIVGLFLLATTGACWYAWRGKWLAFGLFGALAALTRMTGLLVIAVGVIRLLEAYRPLEPPVGKSLGRCWKPLLLRLPLTLLPAAGTLLYLLLNSWVDGDPFAFVTHQEHWYQGYLWISQVVEYIGRYLGDNLGSSFGWAVWAPALALFVVGLALLYWAALRKGHPAGLLAYGFCFFVATYSLSWLLSAGRYLSTCFVLFLFLAKLTQRRPALRAALLGGEGVLLGVYLCAFLAGAQVM